MIIAGAKRGDGNFLQELYTGGRIREGRRPIYLWKIDRRV